LFGRAFICCLIALVLLHRGPELLRGAAVREASGSRRLKAIVLPPAHRPGPQHSGGVQLAV
jgi:hypothetical protein